MITKEMNKKKVDRYLTCYWILLSMALMIIFAWKLFFPLTFYIGIVLSLVSILKLFLKNAVLEYIFYISILGYTILYCLIIPILIFPLSIDDVGFSIFMGMTMITNVIVLIYQFAYRINKISKT